MIKTIVKRAAATLASVGVVLGIGLAGAPVAGAAVPSGGGGTGDTVASCGLLGGVTLNDYITTDRNFTSEEVAAIYYVKDLTTGAGAWTRSWTYSTAYPSTSGWVVIDSSLDLQTGHNYQIYADYAWYTGRTWEYAGQWLTTYYHRAETHAASGNLNYCKMW